MSFCLKVPLGLFLCEADSANAAPKITFAVGVAGKAAARDGLFRYGSALFRRGGVTGPPGVVDVFL